MAGNIKIAFKGAPVLAFDPKQLKSVMRMAGTELVQATRALIRGGSGSKNRRSGVSKPGEPPVSHSGDLLAGLTSKLLSSGTGVRVTDSTYYAKFLETGARGGAGSGRHRSGTRGRRRSGPHAAMQRILEPRPFLTKALEMRAPSLEARVHDAILNGIKFKRQKI